MNNFVPTLKHLRDTIVHKVYVFRAGLRTGAPIWRLLIHDYSKFGPSEATQYGKNFFGDRSDPIGFKQAWLHHVHNNPHHWQHWVPIPHGPYTNGFEPLPMPMWAVREMVADWCGASRIKCGFYPWELALFSDWHWFMDTFPDTSKWMHIETLINLSVVIDDMFGIQGSNEITKVLSERFTEREKQWNKNLKITHG